MPRDRRRGRRSRSHGAPRNTPQGQQPRQPVSSVQASSQKTPSAAPAARTAGPARQPLPENPHLGKDLRNIGIVTALMVILLVVLSFVL